MTREKAIVLIERAANELREMMKTITMPTSAAEQLQQEIDAHEIAITSLRQQERFGEVNKALTPDELRQMDGEPVYIVENTEYWAIVNSFDQAGVYLLSYGNPDDYGYFGLYGKTWLAYRQKPEEGTV